MLGVVVALAQAICWATTGVMLRRLSTQLDAFLLNGLRAGLSLLLTIPLIALTGHLGDYAMLSSKSVAFLLGSVIFGGVLGDGLYVISLKRLGIHRAFPISNSHPFFTVILSALLLGEEITWAILVGMVLVIGGVYLVTRPGHPTVRDEQEALSRSQLIAGAAAAVAEESDVFLFLPRTPQKAVPAPRRQANDALAPPLPLPMPKPIPGPRSK